MAHATLQSRFPWTKGPVIINAPMAGFAGAHVAVEVTQAGGLGLISSAFDMEALTKELDLARELLNQQRKQQPLPPRDSDDKLPIGVGFLVFAAELEKVLPVLSKHRVSVVWLFAAKHLEDYGHWTKQIRDICDAEIWIQTGSVADALAISRLAQPDVLVLQGSDAGGHGLERGASIITLIPEARQVLDAAGFDNIALVAAGGIVNGKTVAAALGLGAEAAVMGTRFLACEEITPPHPCHRELVLAAKDGGQSTARSKLFDDLWPNGNIWPPLYDGRGLRNASLADSFAGMSVEENRRLYGEAQKREDKGFSSSSWSEGRATVWAGTGVGLVNEVKSARKIVNETREEAKEVIRTLSDRCF